MKKRLCLLLSFLLLLSLLPGCQAEAANPAPEEMASALLAFTLRDDPTILQDAFGYREKTAVYEDFAELSQDIAAGLHSFLYRWVGMVPEGVVPATQYAYGPALAALARLTFTVEVTALKDDRAVLTFSTQSYDMEPFAKSLTDWTVLNLRALAEAVPDYLDDSNGVNGPEKKAEAAQLYMNMEYAFMGELLKILEPSGDTAAFQAAFVPTERTVNGKKQILWLPEDPEALGTAITSAIFKGF